MRSIQQTSHPSSEGLKNKCGTVTTVKREAGVGIWNKYEEGVEINRKARLAQSVERLTLNQVVGGSSPPVGVTFYFFPRNSSLQGI